MTASYKDEIAALNLAIAALKWKCQKLYAVDANIVNQMKIEGYEHGNNALKDYKKHVEAMAVLKKLRERIKMQKGLF